MYIKNGQKQSLLIIFELTYVDIIKSILEVCCVRNRNIWTETWEIKMKNAKIEIKKNEKSMVEDIVTILGKKESLDKYNPVYM